MIFLRPWAFLLLLIPVFFIYKGYRSGFFQSAWKHVLDPHLMPHVMVRLKSDGLSRKMLFFLLGLWCWLTLAAAGPAFYKTTVETVARQKGLVVVLDMSPAMTEQKLFTARLKLFDLLKMQHETLVGLVITDQYAYTALPLTQDTALFQNIIPTISRQVIPIIGSNPAGGINQAVQLLQQSGLTSGQILLLTGGIIDEKPILQAISKSPYPVSILGIGTSDKVPADLGNGVFWEEREGIPYLTSLPKEKLSSQARFAYHTLDNADLKALLPETEPADLKKSDETVPIYQDIGIYMLLPAVVLVAFVFKPGVLWGLLLIICLSGTVQASPFLRQEQELYQTQMQAVKAYRNGQYEQAAVLFSKDPTANGFYNTGNALALSGQIDKAIAAYEQALKLNPAHQDARFNLEYLKKQQPPPPPQQGNDKNEAGGQGSSDNQNGGSSEQTDAQNTPDSSEAQQESSPKESDTSESSTSDNNPRNRSQEASARQQPFQSSADTNTSDTKERPVTQDMQQQQEWLDRVQSDPGRVLKYRLYRQYKEQIR